MEQIVIHADPGTVPVNVCQRSNPIAGADLRLGLSDDPAAIKDDPSIHKPARDAPLPSITVYGPFRCVDLLDLCGCSKQQVGQPVIDIRHAYMQRHRHLGEHDKHIIITDFRKCAAAS